MRLSCHAFIDNIVWLQLSALAHNLGSFFRQMVLPRPLRHWCLTDLTAHDGYASIEIVSKPGVAHSELLVRGPAK